MGLPADTTTPTPNATLPNARDPMSAPVPKSAADLPPEALDLASRLFDMARAGDTNTLTTYLSAGVPPNLTNHAGDTLLMLAAYHGRADTVQALLARGADPNAINGRGQSPLAGAVFKGWEDVVRVLVSAGANPEAGQPNARDSAVMFRREKLFEILGVEEGRRVPGMVPAGTEGQGGGCPI